MRLEPLDLWLELPPTGPLLPQIQACLRQRLGDVAQPLRWAITAAEASADQRRLRIEAVVLHPEP